MDPRQRPLSPHLQIYSPQLTSMLSIIHRGSGVFLSFGILLFSFWVIALGYSKETFDCTNIFFQSSLGQVLFAAFSAAFFYHFCNGIRHLIWDVGCGFELSTVYKTGWIVLMISTFLTVSYLALMTSVF